MIYELQPASYAKVEPLCGPLRHQMVGMAVLRGQRQGRVLVDHPDHPQTALIYAPSVWAHLVGQPDNKLFNDTLRQTLAGGHLDPRLKTLLVTCHPQEWALHLAEALGRAPVPFVRRRHVCRKAFSDWRASLPEGYRVARIDRGFLAQLGSRLPASVDTWMQEWGSRDAFLAHGLGVVALRGDDVAAWCLTDAVVQGVAQLGVRIAEGYKAKGLTQALVGAATEEALGEMGLTEVAWTLDEGHSELVEMALAMGFALDGQYVQWAIALDEKAHAALLRRITKEWEMQAAEAFRSQQYAQSADLLERIIPLESEKPNHYRILAARARAASGEQDAAFGHLEAAVAEGWRDPVAFLADEFGPLRETDRWKAFLLKLADRAWDTVIDQYGETRRWPPSQ